MKVDLENQDTSIIRTIVGGPYSVRNTQVQLYTLVAKHMKVMQFSSFSFRFAYTTFWRMTQ